MRQIYEYFSGQNVVQIKRDGYEEPLPIPCVEGSTIDTAITEAVKQGNLCLTSGEACFFSEDIPNGILTEDAQLQPPPASLSINDVLPENLPAAWSNGRTTALAITQALTQKTGQSLPCKIVRDAIEGDKCDQRVHFSMNSATEPTTFTKPWQR